MLASTSEVYGDPQVHPQPETYWGNVNPIGPRGVYDEAKRFAEAITMAYHRTHGLDVRIVRIFNTYGPRMRPDDGRVVSNFIVQALAGRAAHDLRRRQPDPQSSATSTTRCAGFLALLDGDHTGPINIGNDGEFTMLELAEVVLEVTGSSSPIVLRAAAGRRPDAAPARPHPGPQPARLGAHDRAARGPRPAPPSTSAGCSTPARPEPSSAVDAAGQTGGPRPRRGAARYQSMVRRRPSSNGVPATKPNALLAPGWRRRRGGAGRRAWWCPSGPRPRSRRARTMISTRSRIGQLPVGAEVDRLAAVVALGGQHDALGGVVDVEELAAGRARAPHLDVVGAGLLGVDALLDEGRDDVGDRRVELVAGAVEVGGHQVDGALAVLRPVGLELHELGQLGDAVGRVGLLGVALPERVLAGTAPA